MIEPKREWPPDDDELDNDALDAAWADAADDTLPDDDDFDSTEDTVEDEFDSELD